VTRGLATLPQGHQELLMVKTRSEDPIKLGMSKSWNVMLSAFSALTLLDGQQEAHAACK